MTKAKKVKPGPEPDRLKIKDDWRDAIEKAIKNKRPKKGWPDPKNKDTSADN